MSPHEIARVVRSVSYVLKQRGWDVSLSRSNRSLSRYVRATRGNAKMTVRISDHATKKKNRVDYDFHPRWYDERHFAASVSRKKVRFRSRKR